VHQSSPYIRVRHASGFTIPYGSPCIRVHSQQKHQARQKMAIITVSCNQCCIKSCYGNNPPPVIPPSGVSRQSTCCVRCLLIKEPLTLHCSYCGNPGDQVFGGQAAQEKPPFIMKHSSSGSSSSTSRHKFQATVAAGARVPLRAHTAPRDMMHKKHLNNSTCRALAWC
jgi:hypothetical protein